MKKRIIYLLVLAAALLAVMTGCGREEKYAGALKIGTTALPKNLNPYSSTATSSTFFVDFFYDTLLGSDSEPAGYAADPENFTFPDGTTYTPVDTTNNPLAFTDNLVGVEGALPKAEGSVYGYEYFDPTEEEWKAQCERESIVFGKDENGAAIEETEEEFMARALETVPNTNWMRFRFPVSKEFSWNDGEAFTAQDIKFTFDYIVKHKGAMGSIAYFLTDYYESSVEDGDFIFVLASNNYSAMKSVCNSIVIIPEHIWKSVKNPSNEKNLSPVGTGPYILKEGDYVSDSTITVTLRSDYSETLKKEELGENPLPYVSVMLMNNEDVLINALQEGSIDLMLDSVKPSKAYAVSESGNYDKVKISSVSNEFVTTLLFNVGEYGIFNEKNLNGHSKEIRQAISLAISQEELITDVLHGMGNPVGDCLVQDYYDHAYTDEDGKYVYHTTNIDRANEILDGTGYKKGADGMRDLSFTVFSHTGNEVVVQALAAQLKQVGITLNYEQSNSTYANDIKQYNHASFDMIINSVTFTADKLLMYAARYGVYADGSPRVFNYSGVVDENLIDLMHEMETSADTKEQYRLCQEVQQYVADLAVEIPLYSENTITFYSEKNFTGWMEAEGASIWNSYSIRYLKPNQ